MSFWGTLGKIGGSLIGLGGSPSADKIADSVLSKIGAVTSGASAGSAAQRTNEYLNELRAAQFNREGQDRAQKQAILMQLLNNTQDFSAMPGNPEIARRIGPMSGGARPSNLTANREVLMALLGAPQIQAPDVGAGGFEKTLGGIGLGSSILSALAGLRKPQTPQYSVADLNSRVDQLMG